MRLKIVQLVYWPRTKALSRWEIYAVSEGERRWEGRDVWGGRTLRGEGVWANARRRWKGYGEEKCGREHQLLNRTTKAVLRGRELPERHQGDACMRMVIRCWKVATTHDRKGGTSTGQARPCCPDIRKRRYERCTTASGSGKVERRLSALGNIIQRQLLIPV